METFYVFGILQSSFSPKAIMLLACRRQKLGEAQRPSKLSLHLINNMAHVGDTVLSVANQ